MRARRSRNLRITGGLLGCGSLAMAVLAILNLSEGLEFNKLVTKRLEVAGGSTTASRTEGVLSMEEELDKVLEDLDQWEGENKAILLKTRYDEVDQLIELIRAARDQTRAIGMLHEAYVGGDLPEDAPEWVRVVHEGAQSDDPTLQRLSSSEEGKIVGFTYEACNDAISGGVEADQVKNENLALIDMLDRAAMKSWFSLVDVDALPFFDAAAYTRFAQIFTNLGNLDDAVRCIRSAQKLLEPFDDDIDLGVVRNEVETVMVGTLKRALKSAEFELVRLQGMPLDRKYTAGWWAQAHKFTESLGKENINLGKVATHQEWNFYNRAIFQGLAGLLLLWCGYIFYTK